MLATLVGKVSVSTAKVPHATFHWLCADCARAAKAQRFKAGAIQFVGLFAAIIGAMIVLAALFAVPLSQRDRSKVATWSWAPFVLLALGVALTLLSRRFRLPGVLGQLDQKPFVLEAIFHSKTEKLEELQRDFPDLYGLGPTPGVFGKPRTFAGDTGGR